MHFNRLLGLNELLKKKSFFLFGPRSTGKTTLIEDQLRDARVYDLLDDRTFQRLLRNPATLEEEQLAAPRSLVVIDEIQKLPKILDEVHRLIKKQDLRFLLTGSSARKLRKGESNLLGGRAWEASLFPLTTPEIPHFDLLRYLNRGGLPHIYLSDDFEEELNSYVSLYLREEILSESLVRKQEFFLTFLDAIALSNGQEMNFESIGSDAGVPARTVRNYVQILIDTLMAYDLKPFLKTKKRKAITRSKLYLFDLGVVNWLAKRGEIKEGSAAFGFAFEHFMINEIRAYLSYYRKRQDLTYWRSTSGFEVDCIIGDRLALEFKSTSRVTSGHLKGLLALKEESLIARYMIVSNDPASRMIGDVRVMPWKEFLSELWSHRLIEA